MLILISIFIVFVSCVSYVKYAEVPLKTLSTEQQKTHAIESFLSTMISIFIEIPHAEFYWDGVMQIPTGRYIKQYSVYEITILYETPDIFLGENGVFFYQGNPIYEAPWILYEGAMYAVYFRLFHLNNIGMPDIFIYFRDTTDGGSLGFYQFYRYINGEYKLLPWYNTGTQLSWGPLWNFQSIFVDDVGRIIVFGNSSYEDPNEYYILHISDTYVELVFLLGIIWVEDDWQESLKMWEYFHWEERKQLPNGSIVRIDGWMYHNPTIYETNIPLILLEPMSDLEYKVTQSIIRKLFHE